MLKELVENNTTELPVLFDAGINVTVSRVQLEVMFQLVKTAQTTGDINEQIVALRNLHNILVKLLKE